MAARTIDGHLSNTSVAKCEGRVLNNVFAIGSTRLECASPSDPNEDDRRAVACGLAFEETESHAIGDL